MTLLFGFGRTFSVLFPQNTNRRTANDAIRLVCFAMLAIACCAGMPLAAQTAHAGGPIPIGSGFSSPNNVAVDGSGNVFVAAHGNNAVYEIVAVDGVVSSSSTVNTIGSGFSSPNGVAVDGNENVFVADSGNNAVKEIVAVGGVVSSSSIVNTIGSGFNQPQGVAVDGSGNVFVADSGNGLVKEIVAVGGVVSSSSTVTTIGSGFGQPTDVRVDGSGNVFVADYNHSAVYEIVAVGGVVSSSSTVNTIGSGFNNPNGVAVDGSGNIYVADYGNNAVKEIVAVGGVVSSSSTVNTIGSGFTQPTGVAVDGNGNVFVADQGNNAVKEIVVAPRKLLTTAVGSTSTSLSIPFTFDSAGSIGTPVVLTQGTTGLDFADAGTGSCTTNGTSHTYNTGDVCTVDVTFTPKFAGTRSGAVELLDNSGAVIATAYIYGTGLAPQVTFAPGTTSKVNTGGTITEYPFQLAFDGAGNMYVGNYVLSGSNPKVVKIPAGGSSASVVSTSGVTLGSSITGIALDGAGNLFIADYYNDQIVVVTPGGVASVLSINGLSSSLGQPTELAFDGAGNLYIADYSKSRILQVSSLVVAGATSSGAGKVINTGSYTFPGSSITGVAVGPDGTIYIAGRTANNSHIVQVTAAGVASLLNPAGLTLSNPEGVFVDGTGNLYVEDSGNSRIVKITTAGVATVVSVPGLANPSTLSSGFGVTVDPSGNLYIPDFFNNRIIQVNTTTPPALTFSTTPIGATDGPQTVTLWNNGNADLTFPIPGSGNNPSISTNFSVDSTSGGTCTLTGSTSSTPGTLAAGASCTLPISFTPTVAGTISGSLVLTDTNLNASPSTTQTISLNGTGQLITPTLAFATIPAHTYGDTPFIVTATSASSGAVAYTITSGPATISGNTLTITGVGTVDLSASQAATADYALTTATTSFIVGKEAITDGVSASSTTATPSQSITLTATVAAVTHGSPSGTVTFYDNGNALGSAVALTSGTAQYATSTLASGQHIITISYSGDANFLASPASPSITINVAAPPVLGFSMNSVGTTSSQTIVPGGTATFSFSLAPTGGAYPGVVSFAATGLPTGAMVTFSPSSIAANGGAQTVTLTVQTSALAKLDTPISHRGGLIAFALLFLPLAGTKRMRRVAQKLGHRTSLALLLLLSLGAVAGLSGCGTGNGYFGQPQKSYTVTVTATSGSVQHSNNVTLQVE